MYKPVIETNIDGRKPDYRGKVRDIFDLDDKMLIIATDRVSAYDAILPTPLPGRGIILTQISKFWFERTKHIIDNHIIAIDFANFPEDIRGKAADYEGRSMLVKKAHRVDFECIVRGYLTGSGYKDYKKTGMVSGITLPEGLTDGSKLEKAIFTPTTKAEEGHDMPVSFDEMKTGIPQATIDAHESHDPEVIANELRDKSIEMYTYARDYAEKAGIVLVDTKLEFGIINGKLILIDEILTPDSSRFWLKADYDAGTPKSLDKQILRDYLTSVGFNGNGTAPTLPDDIVTKTMDKYNWILDTLRK